MTFKGLKPAAAGFVSAVMLFAGATASQAATLFTQSYTGAELAAFATDPANVAITGTAADFTVTTASQGTSLITLDILRAAERGDLILSLDVDFIRLPGSITDNGPIFAFSNPTNAIGTQRQNNSGGSHVFRGAGAAVTAMTGLGANSPFSMSLYVGDENGPTTGSVTEGSNSASNILLPYTLDTDDILGFRLFASNAGEGYRLNSLTITIEDLAPVPLPAGFA
ncbi:hypothetical protein [Pacificoceanicola onchidii]|uniref:hypothetical protein n=1 Tax=Pacificoceanicola onchidii TaxID=2562685 RepID=UPI0010A5F75A|nr:hypothetical protein [Pacificoceanicola onchidii]